MPLGEEELRTLAHARRLLEKRGLLVTLTGILGKPIEKSLDLLPESMARKVNGITRESLEKALRVALTTLRREQDLSSDGKHKLATAASGAVGGLFGLPGLAIELPITTVIMLRSIADIARSEGHDLDEIDTKLACVEVFALGGPSKDDDAAETGYFAVRAALSKTLSDTASHVAAKGMSREGAPVIVRLVDKVATRFGVVVQDKFLLEAVPVVGAASGALVNTVFMSHFQNLARGHFIVKRLEKRYGTELVRTEFEGIRQPKELPPAGGTHGS